MSTLTTAQRNALATLEAKGAIYAYNGVSSATAAALVRKGCAEFEHSGVSVWTNRRSGRNHSQADWKLILKGTSEA